VKVFTKDPDEVLDYSFDWSEWLSTGDTIAASEWFIDDVAAPTSGLVFSLTLLPSFTDDTTTAWLDDGVIGVNYYLTNRVTTVDKRIADRTALIKVRRR